MKLTLDNIENEVLKATKKAGWNITFAVAFDCGNAYVTVNGSINAITSVIFDDETGEFSTVYTVQYKEEFTDDNGEGTGEFFDVDNELYMGDSLKVALDKLRLAA